jgi:hypothetical protein
VTDISGLIDRLCANEVRFILVGGVAAVVHGSSRLTQDVDVVYDRSGQNLVRLTDCLAGIQPYLRGAPPGLPFEWSPRTIRQRAR